MIIKFEHFNVWQWQKNWHNTGSYQKSICQESAYLAELVSFASPGTGGYKIRTSSSKHDMGLAEYIVKIMGRKIKDVPFPSSLCVCEREMLYVFPFLLNEVKRYAKWFITEVAVYVDKLCLWRSIYAFLSRIRLTYQILHIFTMCFNIRCVVIVYGAGSKSGSLGPNIAAALLLLLTPTQRGKFLP